MIKVIEEKEVPTGRVECTNCHSVLEYGNADLHKDYTVNSNCYADYLSNNKFRLRCPVCGVEIFAPWV